MIPVGEALDRICAAMPRMTAEQIGLAAAGGRVLADDVVARLTQPPADLSAMDGYAVRAADIATVPARLKLVGEAPAGGSYTGRLGPGEAVRIFTGGPLPEGADTIAIQENVTRDGHQILVNETASVGRHIRKAGIDFRVGDLGLKAGHALTARDIALAAAMNHPWLTVRRRPRIAILSTGNELVMPGEPIGAHQIVCSNGLGLASLLREAGAEPVDLGIAPDDKAVLGQMIDGARGADMLVTTGGASVGDHDLVQDVLKELGAALDFWKVAMRPGKPLMFGRFGPERGAMPILGLPGNPVSSMVCAMVFLVPAIAAMLGRGTTTPEMLETAMLGTALKANDSRQDYLRASLARDPDGSLQATAFAAQDSSMISLLARADCLIVRPPGAPAAAAGAPVPILRLNRERAI